MSDSSARERRAESRNNRRRGGEDGATQETPHLQDALRVAASAAAVGAAMGAARAYSARRNDAAEEEQAAEPPDEPQLQEAQDEPDEADEPQAPEPPPRVERSTRRRRDVRGVVDEARQAIVDLHGAEAESISYVAQVDDGWRVGLEVVEVRRIPDSTDVIATYEVELDDGGDVVRFERVRRYHRSEADRGGRS